MNLSDEERRQLEMLEQELAFTDPDLDRKLQSGAPDSHQHKRAVSSAPGVLTLIAGFALLIARIATKLTTIGAIAFLLMIAGAHWFLTGVRPHDTSEVPP